MNTQLSKQLSTALLLLLAILINPFNSNAQSFLWGKRGGGTGEPQYAPESVRNMATDQAGNVYVLGNGWPPFINVDNHALNGTGSQNMILSSWGCDGHYRWSKVFGSNGFCENLALKTDTLNGVYLVGHMTTYQQYGPGYFSTDTSVSASFRTVFLIKYDTAGNYQWMRMPQSDTVTSYSYSNTAVVDVDVDPLGNSYLLSILAPGSYVNGNFIVPQKGTYMLHYDASGNFISGTQISMEFRSAARLRLRMKRNHKNGNFYVAGWLDPLYSHDTLFVGSTTINNSMYVARLNAQGVPIWIKQSNVGSPAIVGQIDVDRIGRVYVSGYGYPGDQFNGFSITPLGIQGIPIALAIDSNGNNVWARYAESNAATSGEGIILNPATGEAVMIGEYGGDLSWSGYNKILNHAPNTGYDIYTVRFNAQTGAVNGMDSIASNFGADETANAATVDKHGNVYVGGELTSIMYVNNDTLEKIGGYTDWFVAKYGFNNCNCVMPVASFGYSASLTSVQFSYGGSTGVDSVRWNFGDGSSSTQQSPTHQYAASGTYTACLTVYNSCGHTDTCRQVQVSTSVNNINTLANVLVYPNPVQDQLTIETPINYHAAIMTIDGREVAQQQVVAPRTVINTSNLSAGIYLLQLTDANGQRGVMKIVKQ
ncbi:PKD domain-containing protein [Taibaiella soli]|uniref:PKD domain-containing protein n=1 Tax=Taibaiella soli TaxID=1649169 RepID=UPI0014032167|nr:PKD domain-containing protein [Taibaiella soli]